MKTIFSTIAIVLFFSTVFAFAGATDLANTIHFSAPTNFYHSVVTHPHTDPGDNPLSLTSYEFLDYQSRMGVLGGEILFQYALIGAYVGNGKIIHYMPVTDAVMKEEIETEYRGKFPTQTLATVGMLNGLRTVNLTGARPGGSPVFFRFCWIQIVTNIALKVTILAPDAATFNVMTNSLKSLVIDKRAFMQALFAKAPDAHVAALHLQRVEIGWGALNNDMFGVCVFHAKEQTVICTVAHTFNSKDDLNATKAALKHLQDLSSVPNAFRVVLINEAPDIPQNDLIIVAETNVSPQTRTLYSNLKSRNIYFDTPPVTFIINIWIGSVPQRFMKEAEYKVDATLYLRKEPATD